MKKSDDLPHGATVCGAKNRKGSDCTALPMKNGRCRFHGGHSTGPKTPEGLERARKAHWKHGQYSAEAKKERKQIQSLIRDFKVLREKF